MSRHGFRFELLLFLAAAALFVLGFGFSGVPSKAFVPVPRHPGLLRVVTWNVGTSGASGGASLRDEDIRHVARVLESLDADLLLLQEIRDEDQVQELLELIPGTRNARMSGGRGTQRVGVLARRGRLQRLRIPGGPRHNVLAVLFDSESFGKVSTLVLHADAFSSRKRNRLIGMAVTGLLGHGTGILAGDFNLEVDLDKRRDLFSDDEHLDVETYNYVAEHLADAAHGTGSTAEPDRRLDYIFVDAQQFEVVRAGPWKGQRADGMDHDPVIADLRPLPR